MCPKLKSTILQVKNLALALLILLAVLAVYKHKASRLKESNNYEQFSGYVESYTTGMISRESPIRVRLAVDVQTLHTANEPVENAVFSFSPEVKGKAYWLDSRTIEFRPEEG